MQIFYVFILVVMLIIIFLVIRYLVLGKKSIPVALFSEARRNENSGNFEDAVISYENALREFQKARFPNQGLRNSIIQKIKVLQTTIDYQNSHKH